MHSDRHEADRVREDERALEDRRRRDAVCDVDDLRLWCDALHDAVAGAHEVVLQPEVAQERDEHARSVTACGASYRRRVARPEQRRSGVRRASPHTRAPPGRIRTNAVRAWRGSGLVTTAAAYSRARRFTRPYPTACARAPRVRTSRAGAGPVWPR